MASNDDGGIVGGERYVYDAYGNDTVAGGFPFRYTGQKLDRGPSATPMDGLYYYKARYYDPQVGRFLQTDPIGYQDQQNLYAYVHNDPVNATDPTGMFEVITRGNCQESCQVIDRQDNGDTLLGVYTRTSGPEFDPRTPGSNETACTVCGQLYYMTGLGDAGGGGAENINVINNIDSHIATRLGKSLTGELGTSMRDLVAQGGGLNSNLRIIGDPGDVTSGAFELTGMVGVSVGPNGFDANGVLTGVDDDFDYNSNPARGWIGNAAVVGAGWVGEIVTLGRAQTFTQQYYGTIHFNFRNAP